MILEESLLPTTPRRRAPIGHCPAPPRDAQPEGAPRIRRIGRRGATAAAPPQAVRIHLGARFPHGRPCPRPRSHARPVRCPRSLEVRRSPRSSSCLGAIGEGQGTVAAARALAAARRWQRRRQRRRWRRRRRESCSAQKLVRRFPNLSFCWAPSASSLVSMARCGAVAGVCGLFPAQHGGAVQSVGRALVLSNGALGAEGGDPGSKGGRMRRVCTGRVRRRGWGPRESGSGECVREHQCGTPCAKKSGTRADQAIQAWEEKVGGDARVCTGEEDAASVYGGGSSGQCVRRRKLRRVCTGRRRVCAGTPVHHA